MDKKLKYTPFIKIMVKDDFSHHLRLPPAFVETYGDILPENVTLKTYSGKTWDVKLDQIDEEECCFTWGWSQFVEDVSLKMGECLEFSFNISTSTFDVFVGGIHGCQKIIPADENMTELGEEDVADEALIAYIKLNTPAEVDDEHEVEKKAGIDGADSYYLLDDANPHFKIVLKEHHRSRVLLRKKFAKAAGLMGAKAVVLKYAPEQRYWPVFLEHNPGLNKFRLDIGVGWDEFRKKNGLVMGKTYLFEYIRDTNVIQVKVLLDGEDH